MSTYYVVGLACIITSVNLLAASKVIDELTDGVGAQAHLTSVGTEFRC